MLLKKNRVLVFSFMYFVSVDPMDRSYISLQGPFVAAFASSNSGDVSPNINGPKCKDTGMDCDFSNSTCGGSSQNCLAFGPGTDMKDSTYIIGKRQFQEAKVVTINNSKLIIPQFIFLQYFTKCRFFYN